MQDTILIIPPYPYCIDEVFEDVPLDDCWFACPQLLFTCYLPLQFLTSKTSTRGLDSQWAAVTQQQLMAGVEAMCMR